MRIVCNVLGILLTIVVVVVPFGCKNTTNTQDTIVPISSITPTSVTTTKTLPPTTTLAPATNANGFIIIDISSAYADPAHVKGTKFVWINEDDKMHSVTNDEYEPCWEFVLDSRESKEFTITTPGSYVYFCKFHDAEYAEIVVN
jgi:plastocyanin